MKKGKPLILALISSLVGGFIIWQLFLNFITGFSEKTIIVIVLVVMIVDFFLMWYTLSKNKNLSQDND